MLVLLAYIFINLPVGKRVVRNKVQSFLQEKLHTKVAIGSVDYSLPQWLKIKGVYIEDQQKDTLAYGEEISADLDMIKLMFGYTDIEKLYFKNILLKVNRGENDTSFNYRFVLDAFTGNKSTTSIPDTAALKLTLNHLVFDNVALHFSDEKVGTNFKASIKVLNATLTRFQPDRVQFGLSDFYAKGINFKMNSYKEIIPDTTVIAPPDSMTLPAYALFITAKKFNLQDVNVSVSNSVNGMDYGNNINHLGFSNVIFSLGQSIAIADSAVLDSSIIKLALPVTAKNNKTDTVVSQPWLIKLGQLNMRQNEIAFDDINEPKKGGFDAFHIDLQNVNTDIQSFLYSYDTLKGTVRNFSFKEKNGFSVDSLHVNYLQTPTQLTATELYFKTPQTLLRDKIELTFDTASATKALRTKNSIVAATISNSVIAFNDLYQVMPSIRSSFPPSKFANLSLHINTELRGNLEHIYLPYLQLSGLTGSSLSAHGNLYNVSEPRFFSYDLIIEKSRITKSDLLKFIPAGNAAAMQKIPSVFSLSGHITGNSNNVVADVKTSAQGASFNGRIALHNISNPALLTYDLDIRSADINKNFIMAFLPPGSIPSQINLPENIKATGTIKATDNSVTLNTRLNTSYGKANVKGYLNNYKNPELVKYDLDMNLAGFNVGRLIRQDSILGLVSGHVNAKGRGFNYKTMVSDINGNLDALTYKGYTYHDILFTSSFKNGIINSEGKVNDDNLRMKYNLLANVQGEYPTVDAKVRIDTVQLQALHFYSDTLNASFTADIKMNDTRPRNLDLHVIIDSTFLQLGTEKSFLDSMVLVGTSSAGIDDIRFTAPFAEIHANGAFDYDKVGTSLAQYINNYYKFSNTKPVTIPDQQLTFEANIQRHPIVLYVVPGLYDYKDINIKGSYSSALQDSALNFTASLPYVFYGDYILRSGRINVASRNEKLNYDLKLDTLSFSKYTFYGNSVKGYAAHDSLAINALTQDNKGVDWFGANASVAIKGDEYNFRLNDNLLLNYERWNVAPDNLISYSPRGWLVNNFRMNSDTASITINSRQQVPNSPIDVKIDNFNLKSLSALISNDTLYTSGIMDATLVVDELDKSIPAFTGNAEITNFAINQQPIGNIKALLQKKSENTITGSITLTGNGNDVEATGDYFLNNPAEDFRANINMRKMNLKTLQSFTAGLIQDASGSINGNIVLNGKFSEPHWQGQLNFDTARFTLSEYGSVLRLNQQHINLNYPDISFDNFIILDSLSHEAKLNGKITALSLNEYDLNLDVNAKNFIVINTPNAINNEIYGYAAVDADMRITGNSISPNLDGNVLVNDGSKITIVIPEQSFNKDAAKAVVRFIDRDTFAIDPPKTAFQPVADQAVNFARYLNYNFNIEVHKNSTFTIIVDPATGDKVVAQGDAQLNAGVDPGGNLVLAGNYELDKGTYELNYQFLQRKFKLMKGSSISFAGAPMNARVNITAEYTALTSSRDLLSNEVTDVSPRLANSFNQKIPFRVILYLTGELSRPDINFNIELPEESNLLTGDLRTTIENKLAQLRSDQAATNKQVFSLLLLGRFVGEQSSDFFKGNGSDFSDLARQSVSEFLSAALNEIAANLFKGIDVDLNLNTYRDFSNGGNAQRTDLNVTLSKSFLDDRLVISVGTNFGVEGQDPARKAGTNSNSFMPDVAVAYKLTKDGRYMIRAYRKNQFEVLLDGYVVETGISFIVTMDYDKFHELFRRKK
ncbi:MAG: translocation/assembly module TamB domain-containing protein [Ferruginibacter sp.]